MPEKTTTTTAAASKKPAISPSLAGDLDPGMEYVSSRELTLLRSTAAGAAGSVAGVLLAAGLTRAAGRGLLGRKAQELETTFRARKVKSAKADLAESRKRLRRRRFFRR